MWKGKAMHVFGYLSLPGSAEMLVLLVLGALIIPTIFHLFTLQTALSRCSAESRTLPPGLVWLGLIPLFNLIWSFVLVISIAKSLGNEFRRRGIVESSSPGVAVGLAMSICAISFADPFLGIWGAVAGYVLWVVYWVMIARYSSRIAVPSVNESGGI